jgi:hypothetical protein
MNTEEFKIETGIPIPPRKRPGSRGGKWVCLLQRMNRSDSAVIPYPKLSCVYAACRRLGFKVRVQAQAWENEGDRLVRVWRLK